MNPPHESPDFKIGAGMMSITTASSSGLFIAIIFILTVYAFSFKTSASARLPIINPPRFLDFGNRRRLQEFTENSLEILKKGRDTYPDQPYLVFSPFGAQTVMLPTSLIDEVKSHPALGFSEGAEDVSSTRSFLHHLLTPMHMVLIANTASPCVYSWFQTVP